MKKSILIIAFVLTTTLAFSQTKPVKRDTTTVALTKDQAVKILNLLSISAKGCAHSADITAAELTYINEVSKELAPLLFNKYFNKDGSPKK